MRLGNEVLRLMNLEWMKQSVGIAVHWTSQSACVNGMCMPYQQAVESFDVKRFVSTVVESGAGHCLFTLTHAEQYLAFPNEPLERLLPGRTTRRDLIGEIADGLSEAGIRLIVYYNHSCNDMDDPVWKEACGYAAGIHGDLDAFAQNIIDIVEFTARRYGQKIAGWWFDSAYSVDPSGPENTISCDMGDWKFPWKRLFQAAKAGNPNCAVCCNAGVGSNYLYSPDQDYYPGETVDINEQFAPEEVPGMIGHRWTTIDSTDWVFSASAAARGFAPMRFSTDELSDFVADNLAKGRMTTFNMEVDQTGLINPAALEQFARIMEKIRHLASR